MSEITFEFVRAAIAQSGMQALAIIPNLNELKDGRFRRGFGFKRLESALSFQRGMKLSTTALS